MDIVLVLRSIAALLLVIGCIYGLALLVRRSGEKSGSGRKRDKKLRIIEGLMIDQKRRLLRVENENGAREYVILLGVGGEVLVDAYDLKTKVNDFSEDFDSLHMAPKWPQNEGYEPKNSENIQDEIAEEVLDEIEDEEYENLVEVRDGEKNRDDITANVLPKTAAVIRKRPARKRGNPRKS